MVTTIIKQAVVTLAGRCDKAATVDGVGFNGGDAPFGHSLAAQIEKGKELSPKQVSAAFSMLQKYKAQLERCGITLPKGEEVTQALTPRTSPSQIWATEDDYIHFKFPYDPAQIAKAKELRARWMPELKVWRVAASLENAKKLAERFPDFEMDVIVTTLINYGKQKQQEQVASKKVEATQAVEEPQGKKTQAAQAEEYVQSVIDKSDRTRQLIDAAALDIPLSNGRTLYGHQKLTAKWAIAQLETTRLRGVVLALDMGLGKTLTSLIVAKAYKQVYGVKIIVICPASLRDNWAREAEMVGVEIEHYSWAKLPPKQESPYMIIGDEAHAIQSGTASKRGAAFLKLSMDALCRATLMLTGTPMKNGRPTNLYPLLKVANHEVADNKKRFESRYCNAHPTPFCRWDVSGASHLDELHTKTRNAMLRLTKDECLDLPEKTRVFRDAELSTQEMAQWKADFKEIQTEYMDNCHEPGAQLVCLGKMRKAASMAKLGTAIALAEESLEENEPVVIFVEFKDTANALHTKLGGCLLTGDTPQKERQGLVDRFQAGEEKVFISTSGAGGVGITLTASRTVIMVDRPWTPGDAEQCEARCIAKDTPVLTPNGWVPVQEIQIGDLVITKNGNIGKVIDSWSKLAKNKKMVEINLEGWDSKFGSLITTGDHRWLLSNGEWVEAWSLRPGDKVAMPSFGANTSPDIPSIPFPADCRVSPTFINRWGTEHKNGRLKIAPEFIDLDSESLFCFGYFVGDGFAGLRNGRSCFISFAGNITKKSDSIRRIEHWVTTLGLAYNKRIKGNGVEVRAYSKEWALCFREMFGVGAYNKHLPEEFLSLSPTQSLALLSGLMASDGYYRKNRYEYSTMSSQLASQVFRLIIRCGFKPTVSKGSTGQWLVAYTVNSAEQTSLVKSVLIRFPKKENGVLEKVYDLTVDSDPSFCIGTAVVHNCHRIGTKNAVTSYWLQWSEADWKVDGMLTEKQERIDMVLQGDRKTMRGTKDLSSKQMLLQLAEEFLVPPVKKKERKTNVG